MNDQVTVNFAWLAELQRESEAKDAEIARLRESRKKDCIGFFQWWWNQPGTNTADGYDRWQALQESSDG